MSVNAAAARVVAFHVEDPGERLQLLHMIGLITADGAIAPDDKRTITMAELNKLAGVPQSKSGEQRPATSTAPAGLRDIPEPAPPVVKPAKTAPAPKLRPFTPTRGFNADACGQNRGYMRHKRAGQEPCPPCKKARAAEERRNKARREAAKP